MIGDSAGLGFADFSSSNVHTKAAKPHSPLSSIIEIRQDREELDLLIDIKSGLRASGPGRKTLPTLLLYDEPGLKLFEKITFLDEYYLTNAEIEVLHKWAGNIADRISPNSIVLELGSGNLRKIKILLDAFEAAKKPVEYYALDVSRVELERTLAAIPVGAFKHVKCFGLHGTYDDGLQWLKSEQIAKRSKAILSMGSSIGNFARHEAVRFLRSFSDVLQTSDVLLIGIDACKDPDKVFRAYNDSQGVTHEFVLNGLQHANQLLGHDAFDVEKWRVIGEYDEVNGKHHAFVSPVQDMNIDGILIKAGERIRIEESFKYDLIDRSRLWEGAGLIEGASWTNAEANYGLHMAYKPKVQFSSKPEEYAASAVPTLAEWKDLWTIWDLVTQQMIPKEELLAKPIKLRNACIFYLGHIPTFLAIHLEKASCEGVAGLRDYQRIFERGIDPDVDNPELCHDHSEIPDEWPPEVEILAFQSKVRDQVKQIYDSRMHESSHAIRKALWISFEHEVMHIETLLYMLIQSEKTLPPPGVIHPDFEALACEAKAKTVPNKWFTVPSRTVTLGLNDDDKDTTTNRYFGWDNEKPQRRVKVKSFSAQARPITNGEYVEYLKAIGSEKLPASWSSTKSTPNGHFNGHMNGDSNGVANAAVNGENFVDGKEVKTVFGSIPLKLALDWPVMASYDELLGFAHWAGGRIPTMEEVKSIYEYAEELKVKDFVNALGETIPAVNGHLINDGVEETPPHRHSANGEPSASVGPSPHRLFVDLEDANVGFKHWHPLPVTAHGDNLAGQGELGGVWEWTSTVLEKHEGFEPMQLYPGYTADFFDKKHNIVLGGSWATHPRIAGRRSFVNWYQRNYPFVWAGARLVRDL
ncbi:dimethylhistidine N-methyltransferase [Verruconis gallopava]|uniref:Dimethylhistidine N-methyltransferase n=1 Tax=Verruconis gallopava TaxID=253628 RepID=A0A0D1YM89_9PEZI|nr:dimethylhistidine N-methyltransferase [Verruconis gallopava]KIW01917.1 dimethylhistidine N-methyltransferase [Verruconis gallopava]